MIVVLIIIYIIGIFKIAEAIYVVEKIEKELQEEKWRREIDDGK